MVIDLCLFNVDLDMIWNRVLSVLQKHKPGELVAAAARADYSPGHCIIHSMRDVIAEKGSPSILMFGANHVNHLKTYVKALKTEDKLIEYL